MEKRGLLKFFISQCDTNFKCWHIGKFVYLKNLPIGSDLRHYVAAVNSKGDVIGDDPVILTPVYAPFEDRNGNWLLWLCGSTLTGSAIFLTILNFVKLKAVDVDEFGLNE